MKAVVVAALGCAVGSVAPLAGQSARPAAPPRSAEAMVRQDLSVLAADSLEGRFTGTPAADAVARYLARRLGELGVTPAPGGWLQEFSIASTVPGVKDIPEAVRPRRGVNVVGVIPGRDPALRNEYVVVGAHYDHLGHGESRSSSLGAAGEIYNGADDNASGTVALLDVARQLGRRPPARSVVLVAFSGEELGLLGSAAYVAHPAVPLEQTVAMVNLDMVGRLRNDRLLVYGSETATEFPALLDSLNAGGRFDLHYSGDGFGRSDQQSFYVAKKPVLHLFTDLHEDYHRPSDDWDKINVAGVAKVAAYTADITRAIADRKTPLTFVFKAPPPPPVAASGQPSSGYGAYFGSIPDMASGGPGVRLSGVRPDSPADKAGLKEGDVLLSIGRFDVPDLQGMTDALRNHKPGDTATVRFRRGATVDSATVVFGRRGG
ncbi:MAG: M28 family peptidase [Gemmatimonadales bacterium]